MRELFIYYKARPEDAAALQAAVETGQAALRSRHPGLVARLLRRREASSDGTITWMETYAMSHAAQAGGVSAAVERDIEAASERLGAWLVGARHVEVFEACA